MAAAEIVFNIQRFSLHDGPGIRTTVFLKGCSMRCFWCHNPEGQNPRPELRFFPDRCLACGQCVDACPNHAHELRQEIHLFHRDRCEVTGRCIGSCYSGALQLEGQAMTVDEVMVEVLKDREFYKSSNGGVTLSGGEPALSKEFSREVLRKCREEGLHTAIETCGEYPWSSLEALIPFVDLVMMDIKHLDPDKHKRATGHSNERILSNARQLAMTGRPIVFRTPIVLGVNDTEEEVGQVAAFVRSLIDMRKKRGGAEDGTAGIRYELLAFHKLAADKYASLGRDYTASSLHPPTTETMGVLVAAARRAGVETSYR